MPPAPAAAPPFDCDFLTLPTAIADDLSSVIYLEFNNASKAGGVLRRALNCPASNGPAPAPATRSLLNMRWALLIASCACLADLSSPLATLVIGLVVLDPIFFRDCIRALEACGFFDSPLQDAPALFTSLLVRRDTASPLGPEFTLTDTSFSTALAIDETCFDPDYIPWPARTTFQSYGNPDLYPVMLTLHELGERWVFTQVGTERFWYVCARYTKWLSTYVAFPADEELSDDIFDAKQHA